VALGVGLQFKPQYRKKKKKKRPESLPCTTPFCTCLISLCLEGPSTIFILCSVPQNIQSFLCLEIVSHIMPGILGKPDELKDGQRHRGRLGAFHSLCEPGEENKALEQTLSIRGCSRSDLEHESRRDCH
jgi:hypothetical protein